MTESTSITIEPLDEITDDAVHQLADVLVDAVRGGAGVSFTADLTVDQAREWWRTSLAARSARAVVLVARDDGGIVGTVQLQPAWAPNQAHRADVVKLLVHRRARGRGIARALMAELERQARSRRITLLLLDTCKGSAAERLYGMLGWTRVGEVPRFATNPDGSMCDTVFFYKEL